MEEENHDQWQNRFFDGAARHWATGSMWVVTRPQHRNERGRDRGEDCPLTLGVRPRAARVEPAMAPDPWPRVAARERAAPDRVAP